VVAPPWDERRGRRRRRPPQHALEGGLDSAHGDLGRGGTWREGELPTIFLRGAVGRDARSLRRAALLAPPPCVLEELAVGFVVYVASVCPTCFTCLIRVLQEFRADVAKVDLDFSTLQMLIPNTNV
jgi:hypothetical protein